MARRTCTEPPAPWGSARGSLCVRPGIIVVHCRTTSVKLSLLQSGIEMNERTKYLSLDGSGVSTVPLFSAGIKVMCKGSDRAKEIVASGKVKGVDKLSARESPLQPQGRRSKNFLRIRSRTKSPLFRRCCLASPSDRKKIVLESSKAPKHKTDEASDREETTKSTLSVSSADFRRHR